MRAEEVPEADLLEQEAELAPEPEEAEPVPGAGPVIGPETPEADAVEQAQVLPGDEDEDYR
ncbi:hypothetical protein [Longispora albida]|uniref:hypothetical protein n=1 Tax=Longispora albida TaxID=203523 RepID=UPI000361DCC4|nr:hypothetical protein [Longispora albida]